MANSRAADARSETMRWQREGVAQRQHEKRRDEGRAG